MSKKVYIASSVYNIERVRRWQVTCRSRGFEIAYDWTKHGKVDDDNPNRPAYAIEELNAVTGADLLMVLLPGGRGTHVEIGAALACGTPVIIVYGDERDLHGNYGYPCMFYDHPEVHLQQLKYAAHFDQLHALLDFYADEANG